GHRTGRARRGLVGRVRRRFGQCRTRDLDRVLVVPEPVLAGLEALHDWVARLPEVRRRVLLRRGVAAAHVTARGAAAKVHPPAVGRQTLLAAGPAGRDGWVDA